MDEKLHKKLRIPNEGKILILNSQDQFKSKVGLEKTPNLPTDKDDLEYRYVHMFCNDEQEVKHWLPIAMTHLDYDGIYWISYPEGTSGIKTDINREKLWQMLEGQGYSAVSMVSIDAIRSAIRYRPKEMVGK